MSTKTSILPSAEEIPDLIPRPGSVTWRYASDSRLMAGAGYALLLQVSHPTIGAGVHEHSNFAADPWGRLLRTLDYVNSTVYGGPDLAGRTGRRIREMHKQIRGVLPDGRPYSALEPEAYAWVHATLAEAIVRGRELFCGPLRADQTETLWREWRTLGRIVGVREQDLPETWAEFRVYFDAMVAERLENTQSVHDVLDALARPAPPPLPGIGPRSWGVVRLPFARVFRITTVGLLPGVLRERIGRDWSRANELELRAIGRAARAAGPVMPRSAKVFGPSYLHWRQKAIARGDVASGIRPAVRAA